MEANMKNILKTMLLATVFVALFFLIPLALYGVCYLIYLGGVAATAADVVGWYVILVVVAAFAVTGACAWAEEREQFKKRVAEERELETRTKAAEAAATAAFKKAEGGLAARLSAARSAERSVMSQVGLA